MFAFAENRRQDSICSSQGGGRGLSLAGIATLETADSLLPRLLELARG
jgi:hypothetical protein